MHLYYKHTPMYTDIHTINIHPCHRHPHNKHTPLSQTSTQQTYAPVTDIHTTNIHPCPQTSIQQTYTHVHRHPYNKHTPIYTDIHTTNIRPCTHASTQQTYAHLHRHPYNKHTPMYTCIHAVLMHSSMGAIHGILLSYSVSPPSPPLHSNPPSRQPPLSSSSEEHSRCYSYLVLPESHSQCDGTQRHQGWEHTRVPARHTHPPSRTITAPAKAQSPRQQGAQVDAGVGRRPTTKRATADASNGHTGCGPCENPGHGGGGGEREQSALRTLA
jgi:hypothetical protein